MRRLVILLFAILLAFPSFAQTKRQSVQKKAKTTAVAKKQTAKKKKTTAQKQDNSIKGLRNRRDGVKRKIAEQERLLRSNKADVKKRLGRLVTIGTEIDNHQKTITGIEDEIARIDNDINMLEQQLATLGRQLDERKARYVKSLRYISSRRSVEDKLMFIFSAKNLTQMYRRLRFVREYAAYQRSQGEMVQAKQRQIEEKQAELQRVRSQKNTLLDRGRQEHAALQAKQAEQQQAVNNLKRQQKTIEKIIAEQRKKDAELNAKIDRLVAEEMARAKARAEAEAKRKAEEAARKKREAEELARKKAAAEAARRENERRVAEAKAREERLKAQAREAANKDAAAREAAEQRAREAEAERMAAERKARVDGERHRREVAKAERNAAAASSLNSTDRRLSGSFSSNRGRLPMPLAGQCRIVTHYGQYNVPGLKNVRLDSNGINIAGQKGASVRAVFDGEVSAVFNFDGSMIVMVRHGDYISVYCNLGTVSVHRGQSVSTGQTLGTVDSNNILQFQLWKGTAKQNPEAWLRR